jgi:DNA-binding response OmpR family regulator
LFTAPQYCLIRFPRKTKYGTVKVWCVALALRFQADVLITDIGLPEEDGFALIREIRVRENERGGYLPALALTGFTRAEDRVRVLAAGFQGHLAKPIDPTELTTAIAALARSPRQRQP